MRVKKSFLLLFTPWILATSAYTHTFPVWPEEKGKFYLYTTKSGMFTSSDLSLYGKNKKQKKTGCIRLNFL